MFQYKKAKIGEGSEMENKKILNLPLLEHFIPHELFRDYISIYKDFATLVPFLVLFSITWKALLDSVSFTLHKNGNGGKQTDILTSAEMHKMCFFWPHS